MSTVGNKANTATSIVGMIKGDGTNMSAATAGTDFVKNDTVTAFSAVQTATPTALSDGATVTWAVNTKQSVTLAAGGSRTIETSGTPPAGTVYLLTVTPTGAYTMSFSATYFTGLTGITQTATNGKTDCWTFRSNGTKLECIGFRADIGT